ncbi:MAG: hypothetical protein K2Q15_16430 [Burkholderiales bacterium]|nr:hypothetical protein [Burkholderiales bacterium]
MIVVLTFVLAACGKTAAVNTTETQQANKKKQKSEQEVFTETNNLLGDECRGGLDSQYATNKACVQWFMLSREAESKGFELRAGRYVPAKTRLIADRILTSGSDEREIAIDVIDEPGYSEGPGLYAISLKGKHIALCHRGEGSCQGYLSEGTSIDLLYKNQPELVFVKTARMPFTPE